MGCPTLSLASSIVVLPFLFIKIRHSGWRLLITFLCCYLLAAALAVALAALALVALALVVTTAAALAAI